MTSLLHDLGTVTVETGSPVVIGEDTSWSTLIGALGGVLTVEAPGNPLVIKEVNGDGEILAATNWTGQSGTYRYAIARASSDGLANARLWTMEQMGDLMRRPWGIPANPNGRGTLAQRDALDPMPDDDYLWMRVEVGQPLELYFRVTGQWLGPYRWQGDAGPADTETAGALVSHKSDKGNPHEVTASQVGAPAAPENAADGHIAVFDGGAGALKDAGFAPVDPAALALALGDKADAVAFAAHVNNTSNPHAVTADQVGAATPGKAIALAMIFGG